MNNSQLYSYCQGMTRNFKEVSTIYFDMDGTIADLYGYTGWLDELRAERATPYREAVPMVDTIKAVNLLLELQKAGFKIGVISWLSMNSSVEYKREVTKVKKQWLSIHFKGIVFDEEHFVQYGTRKDYVAKDKKGILFDDSEEVRNKWRGIAINPQEENICEILEKLLSYC